MHKSQKEIIEFMHKAQQLVPDEPGIPELDVRKLRVKLIAEELRELCQAYGLHLAMDTRASEDHIQIDEATILATPSLVLAYDATLDLKYVVEGNGVAMGLDLEPGWDEVHSSNMTKFIDGHRAPNGKWIKGPSYRPANLNPIVEAQITAARLRKQQQSLL